MLEKHLFLLCKLEFSIFYTLAFTILYIRKYANLLSLIHTKQFLTNTIFFIDICIWYFYGLRNTKNTMKYIYTTINFPLEIWLHIIRCNHFEHPLLYVNLNDMLILYKKEWCDVNFLNKTYFHIKLFNLL